MHTGLGFVSTVPIPNATGVADSRQSAVIMKDGWYDPENVLYLVCFEYKYSENSPQQPANGQTDKCRLTLVVVLALEG